MNYDSQVIGAAISGMVALLGSYMTYRVGMKTAEQHPSAQISPKPDEKTLQQGKQALELVHTGVAQYGNEDEKADLESFERNPQRNVTNLRRALEDLVGREPEFAQRLLMFAQQANMRTGGQGNVTISGDTVQGSVTGLNQGTISSTYTFNSNHDKPEQPR